MTWDFCLVDYQVGSPVPLSCADTEGHLVIGSQIAVISSNFSGRVPVPSVDYYCMLAAWVIIHRGLLLACRGSEKSPKLGLLSGDQLEKVMVPIWNKSSCLGLEETLIRFFNFLLARKIFFLQFIQCHAWITSCFCWMKMNIMIRRIRILL